MKWTRTHTIIALVVTALILGIIIARKKRKSKKSEGSSTLKYLGFKGKEAKFLINGDPVTYNLEGDPIIHKNGDEVITIKTAYDGEKPKEELEVTSVVKQTIPLKKAS